MDWRREVGKESVHLRQSLALVLAGPYLHIRWGFAKVVGPPVAAAVQARARQTTVSVTFVTEAVVFVQTAVAEG